MAKSTNSSKRFVYRIELTTHARDELVKYTEEIGMTQIAICSRLIEWLAAQPPDVRSAVIARNADDARDKSPTIDVVRSYLQRLSDGEA